MKGSPALLLLLLLPACMRQEEIRARPAVLGVTAAGSEPVLVTACEFEQLEDTAWFDPDTGRLEARIEAGQYLKIYYLNRPAGRLRKGLGAGLSAACLRFRIRLDLKGDTQTTAAIGLLPVAPGRRACGFRFRARGPNAEIGLHDGGADSVVTPAAASALQGQWMDFAVELDPDSVRLREIALTPRILTAPLSLPRPPDPSFAALEISGQGRLTLFYLDHIHVYQK